MPWFWQIHAPESPAPTTSESTPISSHQQQHLDAKTALRAILASSKPTATCHSSPTITGSLSNVLVSPSSLAIKPAAQTQRFHPGLESLDLQTTVLRKQADQAERLVHSTTASLKEFGDLQTWAEVVWRDIYVLEEVFSEVDGHTMSRPEPAANSQAVDGVDQDVTCDDWR